VYLGVEEIFLGAKVSDNIGMAYLLLWNNRK
jgi:hypothetical protein